MGYATLKLIHMSAVVLSFSGFAARGVGALSGATWVRRPLMRTLPHVVDTVLVASAFGMLWVVRLAPWAAPWLRAKITGLVLYIVLGSIALRPPRSGSTGRSVQVRLLAWVGALGVFTYIVSVAVTKDPRGVLLWLK